MKSRVIKSLIGAIIVCFGVSISQAQTEARLVLPIGHTGAINSVDFSPDGKLVLTASIDGSARIYEVSSGKEVQILSGHTDGINSAAFSPNGKYALTASLEGVTTLIFQRVFTFPTKLSTIGKIGYFLYFE